MTPASDTVIFLGASTRAAATSARRAGWSPWCADLFADADLVRIAPVRRIPADDYPEGLLNVLADAPQAPVIYTGALENRPDLIARIDRPLWGTPPDVLRSIRDPQQWTQYLRTWRIDCPRVSVQPESQGEWLLKPRKSAGGCGIHPYAHQPFNPSSHFLQERIDGVACSAVYLGTEHFSTLLYGVTQQLIGVPWLNASGFQYCGNIGPIPLDDSLKAKWTYLGAVLGGYPLRGLFGVDAIVKDGVPWPVEINPRYTASMELLERSYHKALLPLHRAVFESLPLPLFQRPPTPTIWGKAILYARRTFAFPADGPWLASLQSDDFDALDFADLPHPGEMIERGHPVLTFFASADTVEACQEKLQEIAKMLDRRLWA